ncbi:MAG: sigma-70 family RNA polymerase sigma factor [Cyclobacteriaceae bacterium]
MQNRPSEQQFENILEENKERIYRICRIYATGPTEPQDLFQEVVFQIWKSLDGFKGNSSINTWVYRIALNVCLRSKMKLEREVNKTTRLESIQFEPGHSEDERVSDKYQALQACLSQLNEGDRSLIVLYLEELPYKEIASITGLTANHVAVKMKRIRKVLFDCINSKVK